MLLLNVCLVQIYGWIEDGCKGVCLCKKIFGWVEGVGISKSFVCFNTRRLIIV